MMDLRWATVVGCLFFLPCLQAQQWPEPGQAYFEALELQGSLELGSRAEVEEAADRLAGQLDAAETFERRALLELRLEACRNLSQVLAEREALAAEAAQLEAARAEAAQQLQEFELDTRRKRDAGSLGADETEYRERETEFLRDQVERTEYRYARVCSAQSWARWQHRLNASLFLAQDLEQQVELAQAARATEQLDAAEARSLDLRLQFLGRELARAQAAVQAWRELVQSQRDSEQALLVAAVQAEQLGEALEHERRSFEDENDHLRGMLAELEREQRFERRALADERDELETRLLLLERQLWDRQLDQSSYDLQLDDVPLTQALALLAQRTGLDIGAGELVEPEPRVSIDAVGVSLRSLLDQLAVLSGCWWVHFGERSLAFDSAPSWRLPSGLRWLELGNNSGQLAEGARVVLDVRAWRADGTALPLPAEPELSWLQLDDALDPEVRRILAGLSEYGGARRLYLSRAQARGLPGADSAAGADGLVYELELVAVDWTGDPDAEARKELARALQMQLRCQVEDLPLRDLIDFLRQTIRLNIVVHPSLDADRELSCDHNDSLEQLLAELCRQLDASCGVWSGALVLYARATPLPALPSVPRDDAGLPVPGLDRRLNVDLSEASFPEALDFLGQVTGLTLLANPTAREASADAAGLGLIGSELRLYDVLNHLSLRAGLRWTWQEGWQAFVLVPAQDSLPQPGPVPAGAERPGFDELPLDAYEQPLTKLLVDLQHFLTQPVELAEGLAERSVSLRCRASPWRVLQMLAFDQGLRIQARDAGWLLRQP